MFLCFHQVEFLLLKKNWIFLWFRQGQFCVFSVEKFFWWFIMRVNIWNFQTLRLDRLSFLDWELRFFWGMSINSGIGLDEILWFCLSIKKLLKPIWKAHIFYSKFTIQFPFFSSIKFMAFLAQPIRVQNNKFQTLQLVVSHKFSWSFNIEELFNLSYYCSQFWGVWRDREEP